MAYVKALEFSAGGTTIIVEVGAKKKIKWLRKTVWSLCNRRMGNWQGKPGKETSREVSRVTIFCNIQEQRPVFNLQVSITDDKPLAQGGIEITCKVVIKNYRHVN